MVMVGQSKRLAVPLTHRQKRRMGITIAVVVLAVAAASVFATVDSGTFGASRSGCVNLTVPSTLGGAMLHECGTAARAWCLAEQGRSDALAKLVRPQCVLAGYPEARASR